MSQNSSERDDAARDQVEDSVQIYSEPKSGSFNIKAKI